MTDQLSTLLDDAEESLADLEETLEGADSLDALGDDELESVLENVTLMTDLADEVEDLLDAVDLTELPEAVDASEVLEAIEVGEIPDALGEGDADDVVQLRQLIRAINLQDLWDAANVRELWEAKRDLEDTLEGSDDSAVGEAVSSLTDDEDGDGGLVDAGDDMLEGDAEMDVGDGLGGEDGLGIDGEDTEPYQTMIQHQAMEGIDEFRNALILTHGKFKQLYEFNREKMRRQDTSTDSRNPTAASTVPVERNDLGHAGRHSTVPKRVRHSSAPGFDRVYGPRFERELERRRNANGGDGDE